MNALNLPSAAGIVLASSSRTRPPGTGMRQRDSQPDPKPVRTAEQGSADAPLDCLIIGAGPAGLTAAVYLARYRRRVALVDAGASRARLIPETRNMAGFPDGISGRNLLARLRRQAARFGVRAQAATVCRLEHRRRGFTATLEDDRRIETRTVVLATGVADRPPPLRLPQRATLAGIVRWCPICDGFEARDRRVFVLGDAEHGPSHARFLRTYSRDVTLLVLDGRLHARARKDLAEAGIGLREKPLRRIHCARRDECEVEYADGERERFDLLYPMLGSDARSHIATAIGASCNDSGDLDVDDDQQTSVDGLYAIGDVVNALNQISVGVAHAALAATAIHNRLPQNWR